MQRELSVSQAQVVRAREPFSTDRTEIAPRSNVVCEDLERDGTHVSQAYVLVVRASLRPVNAERISRLSARRFCGESKTRRLPPRNLLTRARSLAPPLASAPV